MCTGLLAFCKKWNVDVCRYSCRSFHFLFKRVFVCVCVFCMLIIINLSAVDICTRHKIFPFFSHTPEQKPVSIRFFFFLAFSKIHHWQRRSSKLAQISSVALSSAFFVTFFCFFFPFNSCIWYVCIPFSIVSNSRVFLEWIFFCLIVFSLNKYQLKNKWIFYCLIEHCVRDWERESDLFGEFGT